MNEMTENRTTAYVLVALGAFFLATQVFNISLGAMLWPLFIIIPGLMFVYPAVTGGKDAAGLIFPGAVITGTGLILAYQNVTGHWESWAYAWTLYPVMVGLGLQFMGRRTGSKDEISIGEGMVRYGLMAFAGFALFFELLIFGGLFGGVAGSLWPLALIAIGGYLLFKDDKPKQKRKIETPKRKYGDPSADIINPELRRKIDEALREDEDNRVTSNGG